MTRAEVVPAEPGGVAAKALAAELSAPEEMSLEEHAAKELARPAIRTVEIRFPSARQEAFRVAQAAGVVLCAAWLYLANTVGQPAAKEAGAGQAALGLAASAVGQAGGGAASAREVAGSGAVGSTGGPGGPGGRPRASGGQGGAGLAERDLMPFQRLFRTLGAREQRMFREIQEGLLEAENFRASAGRWPETAELGARGVPPFAAGPVPAKERYTWSRRQEGPLVNYLGIPAAGGLPAFLLLVQEPEPLAPADPAAAGAATAAGGDEQHHRLPDGKILHVSTWMRAGGVRGAGAVISVPYASGWTQLLAGATPPVRR